MSIEYHRTMLADTRRNHAFAEAIRRSITPGKTSVIDIGSGTGVLALFALRAGAREVIAIEQAEIIELAAQILHANGGEAIELYAASSFEIDLPAVDLIISETLGNYAYEENILEIINDARRMLKPNGQIIPRRIRQYLVPVINEALYQELTTWQHVGFDLDLSAAQGMSLNNIYVRSLKASDLLDGGRSAQCWDEADLLQQNASQRQGCGRWMIEHPVTLYGIALWWQADLIDTLTLSTSPLDPPSHWEQLYLPLLTPIAVVAGDQLICEIDSDTELESGALLRWQITVHHHDGRTSQQLMDMRQG
jgi:precorrin-6B methylase 2